MLLQQGLRRGLASAVPLGAIALLACATPSEDHVPASEAYVPGLGEIMSATQMRHLKLWYAGQARNWQLASYEVDELEEGFADVVQFHPLHKDSPVALTELVPEFTAGPIAGLRAAIAKKDPTAFAAAHDALTHACNGCHVETGFSFNVVKRPTANPYSNQNFAAPSSGAKKKP